MTSGGVLDVEIPESKYDLAASFYLQLESHRHQVLDFTPPWLEWLRKQTANPSLFMYHHRETGRYVLCVWVYPPSETTRPVAMELEGFDRLHQGTWWPFDLSPQVLLARLQPVYDHVERQLKRREQEAHAKRAELEELKDVRTRAAKRLKQNGRDFEAHQMAEGYVPVDKPDGETLDLLSSSA